MSANLPDIQAVYEAALEELHDHPDRWVKAKLAADDLYNEAPITSEAACRWCAAGLLIKHAIVQGLVTQPQGDYWEQASRLISDPEVVTLLTPAAIATNELFFHIADDSWDKPADDPYQWVWRYNDHPSVGRFSVIQLLRQALNSLKKEGLPDETQQPL